MYLVKEDPLLRLRYQSWKILNLEVYIICVTDLGWSLSRLDKLSHWSVNLL